MLGFGKIGEVFLQHAKGCRKRIFVGLNHGKGIRMYQVWCPPSWILLKGSLNGTHFGRIHCNSALFGLVI